MPVFGGPVKVPRTEGLEVERLAVDVHLPRQRLPARIEQRLVLGTPGRPISTSACHGMVQSAGWPSGLSDHAIGQ